METWKRCQAIELVGVRFGQFFQARIDRIASRCRLSPTTVHTGWGEVALRISARFRFNSGNLLYAAMVAGAGIGLAPTFVVGTDLAAGRLIALMPDYHPVESELSAISPPGKHPSAKVRTLIDFLAARFGPEPPRDEWRNTKTNIEIRREI